MTNGELFENIYGLKATELWAFSEEAFLRWLSSEAPTFKIGFYSPTNSEILKNYYSEV